MRLTKFNPETGQYEYIEPAKTQEQFMAQRKAVIQRLGEYEDKGEVDNVIALPCKVGDTVYCIWKYSDFRREDAPLIKATKVIGFNFNFFNGLELIEAAAVTVCGCPSAEGTVRKKKKSYTK